jgi:ABC-type multidrug transport system fused ATPase/permease subunit
MGNLSIEKGVAQYGGKIGYMPQEIWFQRTSIRNNILFGSGLDI